MAQESISDQNISDKDLLDIVFEKRNQDYGAYQLRRAYVSHLQKAFLIGVIISAVPLLLYFFISRLETPEPEVKQDVVVKLDNLPPPPEIEKPKPKIEAAKPNEGGKAGGGTPAPSVKPTIKFVPPEIKRDEEIKKEEPPPKIEEIKQNVTVSNQTNKGDSLAVAETRGTGNGLGNGNGNEVGDGNGKGDGDGNGTASGTPATVPEPDVRISARPVRIVQPQYTEEARSKRIKAKVAVEVQLDESGKVISSRIAKRWLIGRNGEETPTEKLEYGLEEAALVAANRHLFRPAKLNGKAIPSNYTLDMQFGAE